MFQKENRRDLATSMKWGAKWPHGAGLDTGWRNRGSRESSPHINKAGDPFLRKAARPQLSAAVPMPTRLPQSPPPELGTHRQHLPALGRGGLAGQESQTRPWFSMWRRYLGTSEEKSGACGGAGKQPLFRSCARTPVVGYVLLFQLTGVTADFTS